MIRIALLGFGLGLAMAGEGIAATATTCGSEIGQVRAVKLAEVCRYWSPATHPPCHPANPCHVVRAEILRSCFMMPEGTQQKKCLVGSTS